MTDPGTGNGAHNSKRQRIMSTFNSFTNKGSQNHSAPVNPPTAMSFRFSPDSEELEEISSSISAVVDEKDVECLLDSPKISRSNTSSNVGGSSAGDTSPIKEYLRKNWSKWDKRSLSLDLDIKGKIIKEIDKRKHLMSHFIPEENTGVPVPITTSTSAIPEQQGITVETTQPTISSSESQSSLNSGDLYKESDGKSHKNIKEPFQDLSSISFDNTLKQVHLGDTGDNLSVSSSIEEGYEEIGVDFLENMAHATEIDESILETLFPFSFSPELLKETTGPASSAVAASPSQVSHSPDPAGRKLSQPQINPDELEVTSIFKSMGVALFTNRYTKYLIAMLSVSYIFSSTMNPTLSGIFCFIIGILVATIISQSLFDDKALSTKGMKLFGVVYGSTSNESFANPPPPIEMNLDTNFDSFTLSEGMNQKHSTCQLWMTELDGEYDPYTFHIRQTKAVFVRVTGPFMYIGYPVGKKVPKRVLWSDAPLADISFSKHLVYNLLGAKVSIAPDKLARKRVWNKKYPIKIVLDKFSIVTKITPATAVDQRSSQPVLSTNTHESESLGKDYIDVTLPLVQTESSTDTNKYKKGDKEVERLDCGEKTFYLFARTDRQKDLIFRRFIASARTDRPVQLNRDTSDVSNFVLQKLYNNYMNRITPKTDLASDGKETESNKGISARNETKSSPTAERRSGNEKTRRKLGKDAQQQSFEEPSTSTAASSGESSKRETPTDNFLEIEKIFTIPECPLFLNAILGRIFFDFLRSSYWNSQVHRLIQKKLNYIRRPQFLEALEVKELDLGSQIPYIQRTSVPFIDSQGLWVDLDITYEGNLCVTLETKINLMKLRKSPTSDLETQDNPGGDEQAQDGNAGRTASFLDSDADDSGESSDDEELDPDDLLAHQEITSEDLQAADSSTGRQSKGAKIFRFAEKLANSTFVSESKVVKKVIANMANIPIALSVELKSCVGTLTLNIPPPPTDRIWYGFKTNPDMQLVAKPKVGERAVNLTHVTEFIRKKLLFEFQRVMVLPNMDDVTIPLMEFKLPYY